MPRLRVAFVMQQALGWSTLTVNLKRAIEHDPELDLVWVPITYEAEGGWVERVPGLSEPKRGALRAASVIASALKGRRFDAVVFNASWLAVMAAPWTAGVPTAVLMDVTPRQYDRDAHFFSGQVADGGGPVAAFKHMLNRHVLRSASALFPTSEWTRRSLIDEYRVDPKVAHVYHHGVDVEAWRPRAVHRSPLPQVLFVGGDFHRKGGDLLLDWFRSGGRGRCELRLVTTDPAVTGLQEPGVTVFAQLKPNGDELHEVFWGSDVLTLPSRSEPFGIAAVEGLAAGLPVVASDAGGLAEIVEDGVSGFRVRAGDSVALATALDRLVDSPELRQVMAGAARRRAERLFDAASVYRPLLATLKTMAAPRAARSKMAA
jgi:hypothetical protein